MNRLMLLLTLVLGLASSVASRERTKEELTLLAQQQLRKMASDSHPKMMSGTAVPSVIHVEADGIVFYSSQNMGTVVLSTDDRFIPILGYTNTAITDIEQLPCNMKWWITEMCSQMQAQTATRMQPTYATEPVAAAAYTPKAAFVTTKWGQSQPYNNLTPMVSGSHAPTGCVATAMAQILNYNKWPAGAQFTGEYSTDNGKTFTTETVNSTYQYPYKKAYGYFSANGSNIGALSLKYTDSEAEQIAALMRDCGYASSMMYGADGSGTYGVEAAAGAINCLSYPKEAIKYVFRDFYTDDEWHNMIYQELEQGYPVLYCGADKDGNGHAFVAHGIKSSGLVAVNWGWNGLYDGYFSMDVMNCGESAYSYSQDAVIGWHPTALSTDSYQSQWVAEGVALSYDNTGNHYMLAAEGIYNYGAVSFTGTVSLCFEDMDSHTVETVALLEESDGSVETFQGFSIPSTDITEDVSFLKADRQYKVYLTSQDIDEAAPQRVRSTGGRFFYMLTIGADGIPVIGSTTIDTTTAIRETRYEDAHSAFTYNLNGQRVSDDCKGIVVRKGKKVLQR